MTTSNKNDGDRRKEIFGAIPMRAFSDTRLAATHFRVLGVISRMDGFRRNGSGCYATQVTLAKRAACDRSTVNRVMRDLRAWSYIEAAQQENSKRPQYFVVHQTVEQMPEGWDAPGDAAQTDEAKACPIGHTSPSESVANRSHNADFECCESVTQIDSSKQFSIDSPEGAFKIDSPEGEIDSPEGGPKSQNPRFRTPKFPNRPESLSEDVVVESDCWAYLSRAKRTIRAGYIPTAAQVRDIQFVFNAVCDADTGDRGLEFALEDLCFDAEEVTENMRATQ